MSCEGSSNRPTIINCKGDSDNYKIVTFSNNNFTIKKGAETLFGLPLGGFCLPIENYLYTEIVLQPGSDTNLLYTGGIGDAQGRLKLLAVFSVYEHGITVTDAYISWAYNDNLLNFREVGPVLIITGQEGHLIDSIIVRNPTLFPVTIKVIAGK